MGRILNTHYNSREQAAELIDGGDMSCAWTKDRWTGKKVAEYVTENVEVEQYGPQYYSQRGEDCPPRLDNTLQQYLSDGEEYAYIFRDGEWVCYDMNEFNDNEPELTENSYRSTCSMIDYNEDRRQLQVDRLIEDFIAECEEQAAKLEVTVDYYIAEFI